ncbi:MAG: acyl carrier protein [bacterium]|jgi:acyl carrier protein
MINLEYIQDFINKNTTSILEINNDTTIADLGLDSLELIELVYYIERDFKTEVKLDLITPKMTIQEFMELINTNYEN